MKLVTFRAPSGQPRCGALVDGDRKVIDLQAAHKARWSAEHPALASVLAIMEGGADALDVARDAVKAATPDVTRDRSAATLMAPVPHPPQMRDFLCFEKHLQQAFKAARRVRAADAPDPEAAMRELEAKGILVVPQAWYERPLYYHPNRLNVIGPDVDVRWPAYSKLMDFELEFGCYIGKAGKDIPKERRASTFLATRSSTIFLPATSRQRTCRDSLDPARARTLTAATPWDRASSPPTRSTLIG